MSDCHEEALTAPDIHALSRQCLQFIGQGSGFTTHEGNSRASTCFHTVVFAASTSLLVPSSHVRTWRHSFQHRVYMSNECLPFIVQG